MDVNKNGSTNVIYNDYKKRKIINVSLEIDSNGVVIKITLNSCNMNDAKIFIKDTTKEYLVSDEILEKLKKYYVVDSGYYRDKIFRLSKRKRFCCNYNRK